MDDAPVVCVVQCVGDWCGDRQGAVRLECAFPAKQAAEILAVHESHRNPKAAAFFTPIEHVHDCGVLQASHRLRFTKEPFAGLWVVRGTGTKHFHGNLSWQPRVIGEPDLTHPTLAKQAQQPKSTDLSIRALRHACSSVCGLRDLVAHSMSVRSD